MKGRRFALASLAGIALLATSFATGAIAQDKVSLRHNWYLGRLHVTF